MFKKMLFIILTISIVAGIPNSTVHASEGPFNNVEEVTTYDNEEIKIEETLLESITYYEPTVITDPISTKEIISAKEARRMTPQQYKDKLIKETDLNNSQINALIDNEAKQMTNINSVTPLMGNVYVTYSWEVEPRIIKSEKWVSYTDRWIGIDAYRSSVGMTKGTEESRTISFSLGYTGSTEILDFTHELKAEFSISNTCTVSASQQCPAWTTMNWRPYTVFYKETWEGVRLKKVYLMTPDGKTSVTTTSTVETGVNRRELVSTHELWSRVNSSRSLTIATPLPPSSAPIV